MTKRLENYKCDLCGNIIEVLHEAGGQLVCCNQPMRLLNENKVDAATEKHVPVVEKTENGIKVSVGEVAHPMEADHYIEWIEVIEGDKVQVKFLKPGEESVAYFVTESDDVTVREYCNLHGLWKV
ncbi:MAG: desulfoferrodoxin [Gammaproteobacteria bacterium]|nr:MAG: desulfoferrodoxin [Gammaproteobacteria bacterium]